MSSCNNSENPETKIISEKAETEVKVEKVVLAENKAEVKMNVEGMTCAMGCAKFIEEKVAALDGVVLSNVNFEEAKATFEYDKTAVSPEKIEAFINNIHDGQYKAKIAVNESVEMEVESNSGEQEESLSSVSERIDNISLPQLFTYLLKRMI